MTPAAARPINYQPSVGERIDDAIGVLWPKWQARRTAARAAVAIYAKDAWRGGARDRLHNDWWPSSGSADADLLLDGSLTELRIRSRDLAQNDGVACGIARTMVNHTVGAGIRPKSLLHATDVKRLGITPEQVSEWQTACNGLFDRWCEEADAEHKLDFFGLERLALRTMDVAGDVFVVTRRLPKLSADGRQRYYMLAVQLVEPDRIDTPLGIASSTNPDNGNRIRGGVEYNFDGQEVAFWIRKVHPGDAGIEPTAGGNAIDSYDRYPKYDATTGWQRVLHMYDPERIGQSRGVPANAPMLQEFKAAADVNRFVLMALKVAACVAAFIKKVTPFEAARNATTTTNKEGQPLQQVEPGSIMRLEPGEEMEQFTPTQPANTYESFQRGVSRRICAGRGIPYEVAFMDYSQVNFSSAKAARDDAQSTFDVAQQICARTFQPIWEMLIEEGFINNELPEWANFLYPVERKAFSRALWKGPKLSYVVPQHEIAAAEKAIALGISCRRDECARTGKDWEDVATQLAVEDALYEAIGIDASGSGGEKKEKPKDGEEGDESDTDAQERKERKAA